MIELRMRDALSKIFKRHPNANKRAMRPLFGYLQPTSYSIPFDANNFYEWPLSKVIQYDILEWVPQEKLDRMQYQAKADSDRE